MRKINGLINIFYLFNLIRLLNYEIWNNYYLSDLSYYCIHNNYLSDVSDCSFILNFNLIMICWNRRCWFKVVSFFSLFKCGANETLQSFSLSSFSWIACSFYISLLLPYTLFNFVAMYFDKNKNGCWYMFLTLLPQKNKNDFGFIFKILIENIRDVNYR